MTNKTSEAVEEMPRFINELLHWLEKIRYVRKSGMNGSGKTIKTLKAIGKKYKRMEEALNSIESANNNALSISDEDRHFLIVGIIDEALEFDPLSDD